MRIYAVFVCIFLLFSLISCGGSGTPVYENAEAVTVPVLMFHDVKTEEGGTWSISADNFKNILLFLLDNGYTPVFPEDLVHFADGTASLPDKPVMITLDDGYFSNYSLVLPVITELSVPVTIFVCCGMIREDGIPPAPDTYIISKLSMEELMILQDSPYVQIQSHTYALHGVNITADGMERDNILPLDGEDMAAYKNIFSRDCAMAEEILRSIEVDTQIAFSFPSGKSHLWAEEVLLERGYRIVLNTDYHHRNRVIQGENASLLLLGRMNINDATTEEDLVLYLERE